MSLMCTSAVCDDRDFTCLRVPVNLNNTCGPILVPPPEPEAAPGSNNTEPDVSSGFAASGQVAAPAWTPSTNESNNSGGSNTGAIVGGVLGGVAGAAAITLLLYLLLARQRRRHRLGQQLHQDEFKPSSRPFISEVCRQCRTLQLFFSV
jgi:hypothetical protein